MASSSLLSIVRRDSVARRPDLFFWRINGSIVPPFLLGLSLQSWLLVAGQEWQEERMGPGRVVREPLSIVWFPIQHTHDASASPSSRPFRYHRHLQCHCTFKFQMALTFLMSLHTFTSLCVITSTIHGYYFCFRYLYGHLRCFLLIKPWEGGGYYHS